MGTIAQAAEPPAVCFAPDDYAGFWRRLAVETVDILVIAIVMVVIGASIELALPPDEPTDDPTGLVLLAWIVAVYGYFVILKRSRFHTVGYRLFRVRIVDAHGRPPGLWMLSLRLLCAVAGPLNIVLDILWIPSDRHRQSLRDKIAHTYVVKAGARPAGPARRVFRSYYIMGMSFVFQELELDPASPAASVVSPAPTPRRTPRSAS